MPAAPAAHPRLSRAERRRAAATPPSGRGLSSVLSAAPTLLTVLWLAATVALFVFIARGILAKVTWYLAVDQYGYLTFAHDLMHGRIFHDWPPIHALAARLPSPVDVLSQTYVYDQGRLYCRYSPGFPLILAGWLRLFGDDGAHYLNPTVFVLLLLVALAFQAAVFQSRWRATAGVALIVLCPTFVHLWALTLVRDLPTHLAALIGLTLLLPSGARGLDARRTAAAGLALGYAGSIRPDAVIYLAPALLMAAERWRRERPGWGTALRRLGVGALAVVLGLAPFLAYNRVATGSAFRPTQGMEIQHFLTTSAASTAPEPPPGAALARVGFPPGAWHGGTGTAVQGGGLRLANLPRVLPANIELLRVAYGDVLLGLAIWGAFLALVQRRLLFFGPATYSVLALLFFSCWSKPDSSRYLAGVHIFLPMLIVEGTLGTLDLVRRLAVQRHVSLARGVAVACAALVVAGALLIRSETARGALPALLIIVPGAAAAAALAAAVRPARAVASVAAPALALVLVTLSCSRTAEGLEARARFQRPEMLQARATFARAVQPDAVVITTEDVGRPGENIDYYSGVAHAFYLTDLARWRMTVTEAAGLLAGAGLHPYLLIPTNQPGGARMIQQLRGTFWVDPVADIPAAKAIDYFTAAAFYPNGIHMQLYSVRPHVPEATLPP